MECERNLLLAHRPATDSNEIITALSGIGKVNAALAAQRLMMEHKPDCVLSIGVSGAVSGGLREGDIVIGREVAYHDVWCGGDNAFGQVEGLPHRFLSDIRLKSKASLLIPDAVEGLLITGDQFYISEEEDRRQRNLYPEALAADMESAAVAHACHVNAVPFLAVRIISDIHTGADQKESYGIFWETKAEDAFKRIREMLAVL